MLIYVASITPRIQYIFNFIFTQISNQTIDFTSDINYFLKADTAKFSYDTQAFQDCLCFKSTNILFETNINEDIYADKNLHNIFKVSHSYFEGLDIFAAIFFLISRYEEYFSANQKDSYGRYLPQNSILFKNNILQKPCVDIWIAELKRIIETKFPTYQTKENRFTFLPTIDVDRIFYFKHTNVFKKYGSILLDIMKGDFDKCKYRLKVLFKGIPDPFDNIEDTEILHNSKQKQGLYFFHTGCYEAPDKNVNWNSNEVQKAVVLFYNKIKIGLHASVKCQQDQQLLVQEKNILENTVQEKIFKNRFHYIIINWPQSYRMLIQQGITEDYSMGYAQQNGFRAGTSNSFFWFDLLENKSTKLIIHPFCIMDAWHRTPPESFDNTALWDEYKQIIEAVKNVQGTLITVWHNHTVSDIILYKSWTALYNKLLQNL